jgi:hypothetical protein
VDDPRCSVRTCWWTDKFHEPKKAELTQQLEGQRRSSRPSTARRETRTESGSGAGSSHKGARVLPSTLILRPALPPANVQRAQTAIPMGIHEAPLLCMHDPTPLLVRCRAGMARIRCWCSSASGVESLTALNLLSARFFVEKAFFDWYHTLLSSAAISKWIAGFARHQSGPRERWRTMASSTRIKCNPGAAFLPPPRGVLSTLPSSLRNPWGVPREASKDCFFTQNRVCFQVNGVVFRSMIRDRVLP